MSKFKLKFRSRRIIAICAAASALVGIIVAHPASYEAQVAPVPSSAGNSSEINVENPDSSNSGGSSSSSVSDSSNESHNSGSTSNNATHLATSVLETLEVKGRAPKTGYARTEFYSGWPNIDGCSLRQRIIRRELGDSAVLDADQCTVISGEFNEPYTGSHLVFYQKTDLSKGVQIDHVVALSDAWQKGAQYFSAETRYNIATDPLNLLAVDSNTNQGKSDGDAATWLPPNKAFRCQYVARQISVKKKYGLWVTSAEKEAMQRVLSVCPNEPVVGI